MTKYLILLTVAILGTTLPLPVAAGDIAAHQEWKFTVTLDGDPVGSHVFVLDKLTGTKDQVQIESKADFVVGLIGIPVFRYHHVAHEQSRGGCISDLSADTDHDGDITHVTAQATSDGGIVQFKSGSADDVGTETIWSGCLMNFAYWNPKMREQTRLLDPETGEIEPVTIEKEPDIAITVHGQPVQAHVWRVKSSHDPIDVLYDDKDNWVGLDAKVRGGRALSYRLP